MKKHRQLLEDAPAYVAGFGVHDKQHLYHALQNEGEAAVVRLGFNIQDANVPYRMLGFLGAAYYITNLYFPKAQLQIVANPFTAERVNGQNGERLVRVAQQMLSQVHDDERLRMLQPANTLFASDKPLSNDGLDYARIARALAADAKTQENLRQSAERRSADHIAYVAAHLLIHDTFDSIEPLAVDGHTNPALQQAETIVSLGGAPERNFYGARMLCRQKGIELPGTVAPRTAQIITRHQVAPYLYSLMPHVVDPPYTDSTEAKRLFNRVHSESLSSLQRDIVYPWLLLSEVEIMQDVFGCESPGQVARSVQVAAADVDYWHPQPHAFTIPYPLFEA